MRNHIPAKGLIADEGNERPRFKKKESPIIVVGKDILKSRAWLELPPGIAPQVYLLFLCKRRMEKTSRRGKSVCTNRNELVFPYRAAEKLGITSPRFQRAIDALIEHGFLDIAVPGNGTARECTKYGLSDRWRNYGKPTFEHRERGRTKKGFCNGRRLSGGGSRALEETCGNCRHYSDPGFCNYGDDRFEVLDDESACGDFSRRSS